MTPEEEIAKLKITIKNLKKKNQRLIEDFKIERNAMKSMSTRVENNIAHSFENGVMKKYLDLVQDFNFLFDKRIEEGK